MMEPMMGLYGSGANHHPIYGSSTFGGGSLKSVSDAGNYDYAINNGLDSYEDTPYVSKFIDYDDELGSYGHAKRPSKQQMTGKTVASPMGGSAETKPEAETSNKDHKPLSIHASGSTKGLPRRKKAAIRLRRSSSDYYNEYYDNADNRQVDDKEQIDYEQNKALRRVRRQVYYSSGYNGQKDCQGFPLEINVRSRIKMDRLFPIHGNSQVKKCVRFE